MYPLYRFTFVCMTQIVKNRHRRTISTPKISEQKMSFFTIHKFIELFFTSIIYLFNIVPLIFHSLSRKQNGWKNIYLKTSFRSISYQLTSGCTIYTTLPPSVASCMFSITMVPAGNSPMTQMLKGNLGSNNMCL